VIVVNLFDAHLGEELFAFNYQATLDGIAST
jgi:hypothetical protein